jgi:RNA polymerase sigma factor (TIGR02999 family)
LGEDEALPSVLQSQRQTSLTMPVPAQQDTLPGIATLIVAAKGGDRAAAADLFASLYRELHRLAARQLRAGAPGATIGATTLLHDCYLNLAGTAASFSDRAGFMAYAARAMRGLIVDYIRERRALKRGGAFHLTTLDTETAESVSLANEAVQLNDALLALDDADPLLAELVDLKFFGGFTLGEIAAMRGVSERTAQRDWQKARLYLHDALAVE